MTVRFVDLVGGIALSAKLDPEEMREIGLINRGCEISRFEGHA